jgi:flavin-binding protein dodecin
MAVAKIIELSSTSTKSFEDAINQAISRATKTLHGVKSAWVKEQRVAIENNKIAEYQVNVLVTFIMDE